METLALVIWVIGFPLSLDISDVLDKRYLGKESSSNTNNMGIALAWLIGAFFLFLNVVIRL